MTTIPDTPSQHEDNAQAIRVDLQRLAQSIRGFALLTSDRRRKLTTSGHVDDDYLRHIALLIDAQPEVAAVTQLSSAEIRDHLHFSGAYQGVGEELMLGGRKMSDTLLAERADIGERALRAHKIARDMNTPAGRESLVPHLEAIDREFSRGRRKRAVAKKEPKTEVKP